MAGVVGRTSGRVRLQVLRHNGRRFLQPFVLRATATQSVVYTDEWHGYQKLATKRRRHACVCHTPGKREWARDDDGDGIREVHNNTMEGLWTGLRNFLRPFRGVSKWFLDQYVAMFQWTYDLKKVTIHLLRKLLGVRVSTGLAS